VSPAAFIPVAEQSGLILPLGRWVIEEGCRLWRHFAVQGLPPLPIALNVSAQQFLSIGFVELVQATLRRYDVPPQMIELEITEEATLGDPEMVTAILRALKATGVTLAIDDFGTGYSSMAYLTSFPVDVLKIDQQFVRNLETSARDASIVSMIVALAQELEFKIVAEGVETEYQANVLRGLGCDLMQGFLYSRPLPVVDYQRFVEDSLSPEPAYRVDEAVGSFAR
ncbi:MAG: EAL domain-containing protein, partial [Gammaproteobacteria bacterium]